MLLDGSLRLTGRVIVMPFCPDCGTKVSEENQFCPECGSPLAAGQEVKGTSKKKLVGIIAGCIIAIIIITAIATNIPTPTPTPTQFNTYSKYGFSFEYPKTFSITEVGMLESAANDSSGIVQAWVENVENEELELFQVSWITIRPDVIEIGMGGLEGNLKNSLEDGFAAMESTEGIVSVEKGELVEATIAGHLMFYQYYTSNFAEGDTVHTVYGIAACFYCDKIQKLFSLMTMNNTISAKEDVLTDFQNHLGSFVCH